MKNTSRIFAFVYLLIGISFLLQAQKSKEEYDQKVAEKLATMDLSGVKNGFLLNKNTKNEQKLIYITPKIDFNHTMYSKILLSFVKMIIDSKHKLKTALYG